MQTLPHPYLCLLNEIDELKEIGVTRLRLSPHALDMVAVARLFRDVANSAIEAGEAESRLLAMDAIPALASGFWHRRAGYMHVKTAP